MANAYFLLREDEVGDVDMKMMGIKAKDESFRYRIFKRKEGGYILAIRCASVDEAHRKALWIRDKVFGDGRLYWVKE